MDKILLSESEKISIVKYGSELASILKAFSVIGENIDKMKINISVRTIHKAGHRFEENAKTETFCSLEMKIYNYIGLLLSDIKSLSPDIEITIVCDPEIHFVILVLFDAEFQPILMS